MITLYQQRDFGEKINATFNYAVQQFRSLATALLYIAGPVTLAAGIAGGIYQSNLIKVLGNGTGFGVDPSANPFAIFEQILSPAYWLVIFFTFVSYILVSLTVYAHMKIYARNPGEPISVGAVWQEVQGLLVGSVVVSIVTGIAVFAGILLFILPGVYIAIPLSLAVAVFVFEGLGVGEIFSRCFALIKDKWWSTFGLILVMGIIAGIMGAIFSIPAAIVGFMLLLCLSLLRRLWQLLALACCRRL